MAQRLYVFTRDGNPTFPKGYEVLMDDDYPIPDGWELKPIKLSDLAPSPAAPPWAPSPAPFPSAVKVSKSASITGKTKKKRLTAQGEKVKSEWENLYKAEGCTCHKTINVCPHCKHPGHPYSLENNTALWEDEPEKTRADAIMDAIREMAGKGNT